MFNIIFKTLVRLYSSSYFMNSYCYLKHHYVEVSTRKYIHVAYLIKVRTQKGTLQTVPTSLTHILCLFLY